MLIVGDESAGDVEILIRHPREGGNAGVFHSVAAVFAGRRISANITLNVPQWRAEPLFGHPVAPDYLIGPTQVRGHADVGSIAGLNRL